MATCHPPSNLVACDLSGGFEFVSVGLWDLYLQIAGSLGPRLGGSEGGGSEGAHGREA